MKKAEAIDWLLPHACRFCNRIPHGVAPQQSPTMLRTAMQIYKVLGEIKPFKLKKSPRNLTH